MKSTKIKRFLTAAAAVVLVLSLSAGVLAEGSDQETQPPELPDQQAQQSQGSAPQPGQMPGTQSSPDGSGQQSGSFPGRNGGKHFQQGMNGRKMDGKNGSDRFADEISAAINGLEDGETKNNLNTLFETWKKALEAGRAASADAKSSLTEAESALNEALKAAGLNVQAGGRGQKDRQPGSQGNAPAGKTNRHGMPGDPFSEVRSAIDGIEDTETKDKLSALLDALVAELGKKPNSKTDGSSDAIASAEAALNEALSEAGINVKVGKPDDTPGTVDTAPTEPPAAIPGTEDAPQPEASSSEPASGTSSESSDGKDVSELIDIIRNWLKGVSD